MDNEGRFYGVYCEKCGDYMDVSYDTREAAQREADRIWDWKKYNGRDSKCGPMIVKGEYE